MKMVSMKMEKKEMDDMPKGGNMEAEGPEYPYGLEICLGKEQLEKLGIKNAPEIGTKLILVCNVEATGYSMHKGRDGEEYENLQLQITEMGIQEKAKSMEEIAGKLYGDK